MITLNGLREKIIYRACIDETLDNCEKLVTSGGVREEVMEGFVLALQVMRAQYPGPITAPLPTWMRERGVNK